MAQATLRLFDLLTGGGVMVGVTWIGLPRYWHWPYRSWSFGATLLTAGLAGQMIVGWIVVRLHRSHRLTMLLAFRGVWLSVMVAAFCFFALLFTLRADHGITFGSIYQFRSALAREFGAGFLLMLAGGYLATRSPETT